MRTRDLLDRELTLYRYATQAIHHGDAIPVAGKSISEMIYFVSSEIKTLNQSINHCGMVVTFGTIKRWLGKWEPFLAPPGARSP